MHKPHNLTRQSHRFKYKQPHKSIAARNPPLPQPSCLAQSPNKATNQAQPPSTPQPSVPTQNSNIPTSKIQPTSQQAQEYSAAGLQSPDNQAPQGTPPAKPGEGTPHVPGTSAISAANELSSPLPAPNLAGQSQPPVVTLAPTTATSPNNFSPAFVQSFAAGSNTFVASQVSASQYAIGQTVPLGGSHHA